MAPSAFINEHFVFSCKRQIFVWLGVTILNWFMIHNIDESAVPWGIFHFRHYSAIYKQI